jgi:hypothetical protein
MGTVQFEGHHPHQTSKNTPPPLWSSFPGQAAWLWQISPCPHNNLFTMHWLRARSKVFVQQCKLAENKMFLLLIDFILVFYTIPQLDRPKTINLCSPRPPPVASHIPSLPRRAHVSLVSCCVFICCLAAT